MLYITTRNKNDAHTANHTLGKDRASDGGLYVPFQIPRLSEQEISALKDKSFGQCVADILNLFFSARLDGWDVDFCIGRYPTKLVSMSHRIVVAEIWNNPDWEYARMVRNLYTRLRGAADTEGVPSNWSWIAIRIATLFGLFSELARTDALDTEQKPDIAVAAGDLSAPMAAWYAREMGLPIGNIICGCDESSAVWDLLYRGEIKTANSQVPANIERLIYSALGAGETTRYCSALDSKRSYAPPELIAHQLREGIFAAVISKKRTASIIHNVYRTSTYVLDPDAAMAYGGLQDYRAKVGEGKLTLLITDRSPVCCGETVAFAMGISQQELKERISGS